MFWEIMFNGRPCSPVGVPGQLWPSGLSASPRVGPTLTPSWPGTEQALSSHVLCGTELGMQDKFKASAGLTPKTWRGAAGGGAGLDASSSNEITETTALWKSTVQVDGEGLVLSPAPSSLDIGLEACTLFSSLASLQGQEGRESRSQRSRPGRGGGQAREGCYLSARRP